MPEAQLDQIRHPAPVPTLLVELPSWPRAFLANLLDTLAPRRLPPLEIRSAPAAFWPDVFVKRGLPWNGFAQSSLTHAAALALLIGFTRFFALQSHVEPVPVFEHAQVVYYSPSEYLPPLDTRAKQDAAPKKADPEFSRQPIISMPAEHNSRAQTLVTPPKVNLKADVALPNMVAWSDKAQKPQLAIPPAPLLAAADIQRLAPALNSVVGPPPDASHLTRRRDRPDLQTSVVAPPEDVQRTVESAHNGMRGPAVIAPPPSVEVASNRPIGELNIGRTEVIAPAPSLPVSEQRAIGGGRSRAGSQQVVPPPPSVSSGAAGSYGAPGRVIALNLRPAVGAPPAPPAGNRRGSFAATPEGHAGASGSPGASAGGATGGNGHGTKENEGGSGRKGSSDVPAGLYVGAAGAPAAVAGNPNGIKAPVNSVNPNLIASVRPPRVTAAKPMQPDSAAKLSEAERTVFGNRKFYSTTLNMPNFNSAGGSWVIRFAELNHESASGSATSAATDLSQPLATRKVDPAYPLQLMRENVAGTVIVYAVIHADGSVGSVRVLRGVDERLDRFASEAVAQWKFEPATKAGVPVDVEATFRIPFRPALNF
jgi:TonB family protein